MNADFNKSIMKQNEHGTSLGKTENLLINLTSNLDTREKKRKKHQKEYLIYNLYEVIDT